MSIDPVFAGWFALVTLLAIAYFRREAT